MGSCWAPCQHIEAVLACFCWVRNAQAVQVLIILFLAVKFSSRGLAGGAILEG